MTHTFSETALSIGNRPKILDIWYNSSATSNVKK